MSELSPVDAAQKRLVEACMAQPMTPQGASISAFINTTLLSCKVSALVKYLFDPINVGDAQYDPEHFDKLWIAEINAKADVFENTVKEAPRIISTLHAPGHG